MRVVSSDTMRELEATLFDDLGMSESLIIETVGIRAFDFAQSRFKDSEYWFIIGKGNNGADGVSMARHCFVAGLSVKVFLCYSDGEVSTELFRQIQLARAYNLPLIEGVDESVLRSYISKKSRPVVLVDALLGIGYHPPLDEGLSRLIQFVNSLDYPVISMDIPSGVVASSGLVDETAIRATITLSIELPKIGHLVFEGKKYVGELVHLCAGFPPSLVTSGEEDISLLSYDDLSFPSSKGDEFCHKNDFGHLLIIAGSSSTSGAAVMCAQAALKMGVGLVTLRSWRDALPLIGSRVAPEIMLGEISSFHDLSRFDTLLLGPGLGTHGDAQKLVLYLLEIFTGHLILDADALSIIAEQQAFHLLRDSKAKSITLTPHIGEFARLLRIDTELLHEAILDYLQEFAKDQQVNVILKDSTSFIGTKDGKISIVHFPNRALATAGSGDILAGTVAGLIARSSRRADLSISQSLSRAVLLHSLAGEMAKNQFGEECVLATDLLRFYPEIMREKCK